MTSDEIREAFLRFFEEKGHKILPSSSLVPRGDPTLLLTSAGMVQIKPYFLGQAIPPSPRLASCQKCFRTTDIDSVGDSKHLTFFEMLGNFSVGDYFKPEAIAWAWEFVTQRLALPQERLWITVFLDDDESFGYWRQIGVPADRIVRCGERDNFWGPAGDSGPCGPCSEIHYDFGEKAGCGQPTCGPSCGCDRFLEIWNLVFTQYNQDKQGKRTPLPKPNIDTGMGLERTAAVMQGVATVYDADVFVPLIKKICALTNYSYGQDEAKDRTVRIVAEHSRGIAFLIADGVVPSKEGRGYVLRRLLRRAALYGRKLGRQEPFLAEVTDTVIQQMKPIYPELEANRDFILKVVELEEAKFGQTLNIGLNFLNSILEENIQWIQRWFPDAMQALAQIQKLAPNVAQQYQEALKSFEQMQPFMPDPADLKALKQAGETFEQMRPFMPDPADLKALKQAGETFGQIQKLVTIPSERIFNLYDTYGFPKELTEEVATEHGFSVDTEGFEKEMERQRERARSAHKFVLGESGTMLDYAQSPLPPSEFVGYDQFSCQAKILSLAVEGHSEEMAEEGQEVEVVLDKTPFYAEMGGQVADKGKITGKQGEIEVVATLWARSNLIVHRGRVVRGAVLLGDEVQAEVDSQNRLDIARNHTATHLLQAALRQVLGSHVYQRGSLVEPERLRFDFAHLAALEKEELNQVQRLVNDMVRQDLRVNTRLTSYKEATEGGAIAIFDEKYGETVRLVEIGVPRRSAELCGGTHVSATGNIGFFQIIGESSIGAGIRRIEAVTGRMAEAFFEERLSILEQLSIATSSTPSQLPDKVSALLQDLDRERRRSQSLESELSKKTVESLLGQVEQVNGIAVLSARVPAASMQGLREMGDLLKERLKNAVVVLGTVYEDKPNFLALVTGDLVGQGFHAGEIVKQVARVTGGGGGGRADMAQAGGKDKARLDEALRLVKKIVADSGHSGV